MSDDELICILNTIQLLFRIKKCIKIEVLTFSSYISGKLSGKNTFVEVSHDKGWFMC